MGNRCRTERFFSYSGDDYSLNQIVEQLQLKNEESRFVPEFLNCYGYPQWRHSVNFLTTDGDIAYAVPVYNDGVKEVSHIWFFVVGEKRTNYFVFSRTEAERKSSSQLWMFDYFTKYALGNTPSSGVSFVPEIMVTTRAAMETETNPEDGINSLDVEVIAVTRCNHIVSYAGGYVYDHGIYCWTEFELYNGSDGGSSGGGSGGGYTPPPGDGSYENPGGGSSGSGGNIGDGSSTNTPMAKAIFKHPTMIEENWMTLENMLKKIKKNCMGENLYNALQIAFGKNHINIRFNAAKDGSSFNLDTNTLSLADNMESNQLFHELWHAYQACQEGKQNFLASGINQEIEAYYAQYLYVSKLPEYAGSKWEQKYTQEIRHYTAANLKDYMDAKGILMPNKTAQDLEGYMFYTASIFETHGYGESYYKYDSNRTGLSNFSNLQVLTKNCLE